MKPTIRDVIASPFLVLALVFQIIAALLLWPASAIGGAWTAEQALNLIGRRKEAQDER